MSKRKVSCLPCRMRKVKCDGQKPCQRCTAKNSQDCIYTKPGTVGRPPKNAVVNKLVLSKTAQLSFCKEFIFENVSTISDITSNRYLDDPPSAHLDYYINHFFATYFDKKTKLIDNTRIRLNNEVEKERKSSQERPSAASSAKLYHLTHYFVWMSADISNILTRRLSKLRLTYYTDLNFTISALAADKTTTFFETPSADALVINPLNSLPPQQALKLIEYFYRVHPYSMLINKTMLLQSYWTDTADHLLLSVIYGTTLFKSVILDNKPLSLWDGMAKSRRNPFLDYAHLLLTKATTEATLSKFQAIVLLALFEVTFGYPKKGMALFALSFMIAARLGLFDNNIPPGYSPVEKELLMVTFWAAYKCTVRGCVEMEQVPRDALAHQVHPYPPVNMYKSESYQFDVANGNTTDYNYFNYMVETFYIKSVVARLSCHIILLLPQPKNGTFMRTSINYNSNPISGKLDVPVTNYSCVGAPVDENDFIIPTPDVRASILKVLSDFKNFIAKTKHTWSPLQSYTFSMLYLTYKMAFSFIKHEYVYPVLAFYSIGSFRVELPPGLDLTDVETILRINENMDYIKQTVNETLEFFDNPENYQGLPTHIPHGVVLSALDICSQITMYMIRLDTYNYEARDQLDIILSILSKDKFWDTWEPVDITKKAISEFLLSNPLKFSSASPSTDSTSSSEQPFVLGITELDPMDPLALLDMQLASLPMHDFLSCVDSTTFFDGIQ